jgi:hypothetical protein
MTRGQVVAGKIIRRHYLVSEGTPINTVEDALAISGSLSITRGEFAVYRGQSVYSWMLRPKAFRLSRWYRHERDMVRELISTHPQEFVDDTLMVDRLVRMQHYDLPTRLLDVSQNFLAALFFACEHDREKPEESGAVFVIKGNVNDKKYYDSDSISLVSNLSNLSEKEKLELFERSPDNEAHPEEDAFNIFPATERLLQFVRDEKPYFRSRALKADLMRSYLLIPKKNNRRIVAQSGAFLVFGLVGPDRSPDLHRFQISRHQIPRASKDAIRRALEGLGITAANLFPEIDRAAAFIADRFRNI